MSASGVIVPYFPPFTPYVLPEQPLDTLLNLYGVRLLWQRSHLCPCVYAGGIAGSPDPQCQTCGGLGWYWDSAYGPFMGLITFMHLSPSPDEPGALMSEKFGVINRDEPTLTIPRAFFGTASGAGLNLAWEGASLNDIFTEIDTTTRFEAELQVGGVQTVPYQQNLNIAASGAVTVYDQTSHSVVVVSGYTVSGATVTLPSGYVSGTAFVVSYEASKSYAAWRESGSLPHSRPFGGGVTLPRRFRLQNLDLWLRNSGKV